MARIDCLCTLLVSDSGFVLLVYIIFLDLCIYVRDISFACSGSAQSCIVARSPRLGMNVTNKLASVSGNQHCYLGMQAFNYAHLCQHMLFPDRRFRGHQTNSLSKIYAAKILIIDGLFCVKLSLVLFSPKQWLTTEV